VRVCMCVCVRACVRACIVVQDQIRMVADVGGLTLAPT